jgi:hypothetical protein
VFSVFGCLVTASLLLIGGIATAQTGSIEEKAAVPGGSSPQQDPPPGSCMPIGVTVSGEIVFPFQCKGFIEQKKAQSQAPSATQESTRAAEQGASVDDPSVAKSESTRTMDKPLGVHDAPADKAESAPAAEPTAVDQQAPSDKQEATRAAEKPSPVVKEGWTRAAERPAGDAGVPAEKVEQTRAAEEPASLDSASAKEELTQKPASTGSAPTAASEKATLRATEEPSTEDVSTSALGDVPAKPTGAIPSPGKASAAPHDRKRTIENGSSANCTHYRTYDAGSRTYRDYSGRRRSCES